MTKVSDERAIWLARHVLPHETALRAWLTHWRIEDLLVDDIVQETYAVLAARLSVDDIRNPRAYFFQTARSIILMHLRRSRVVSIRAVEDMERIGAAADEPSPEQQVSDREELHQLARAIADLPDLGRQALTLRVIEGLSQREVGERMGISENAAQKHIAKSIHLLMTMFGHGGNAGAGASKAPTNKARSRNARTGDRSGD
jgi:RNA polymerase sigma factor (sigma-70 family)